MKIYKLSQTVNEGYDTYSDCVVVAKNPEDAKTIHPYGDDISDNNNYDWTTIENVFVEEIGTANNKQKRGVVCASFHAG